MTTNPQAADCAPAPEVHKSGVFLSTLAPDRPGQSVTISVCHLTSCAGTQTTGTRIPGRKLKNPNPVL